MKNKFSLHLGGAAGEGIMVTGEIFAKVVNRSGYHLFDFVEYPSLIRGGHNLFSLSFSNQKIFSTYTQTDLLVALNQTTLDAHRKQPNPVKAVIFDPDKTDITNFGPAKKFPLPFNRLANEVGKAILGNTIALGATIHLLGGSLEIFQNVLKEVFCDKGEEVINLNLKAAATGFEYSQKHFSPLGAFLKPQKNEKRMVISGNEAIGLGALAAGMKFAAIYPMTPINPLLTFLAQQSAKADFVYFQPEDEIAGVNSAIGAAFAGDRSMVATSGGGFALMNEGLSLAGITETPIVVVFGQRSGPATGLPTWTGQEDLLYSLTCPHGEFPRIVLTPGDAAECFDLTWEAFNLADICQTPVIILVDKFICESYQDFPAFSWEKVKIERGKINSPKSKVKNLKSVFSRYQLASDGVSPRAFPGQGLIIKANSDEHDPEGFSDDSASNRTSQVEKRMKKIALAQKRMPPPNLYGPKNSDLTLVSWGSTKGPILEALDELRITSYELRVNFLHLNWLSPFPSQEVAKILSGAKKTLLIENNFQGQLGKWIRMQTGIEIKEKFLKYDGRQFYPEEIIKNIKLVI